MIAAAYAVLHDWNDAVDIAHDVALKFLANPKLLLPARDPHAFLITSARNRALDTHKTAWANKTVFQEIDSNFPDQSNPNPFECAAFKDTCKLLNVYLDRLPPEQYVVIYLRIWEDLTFADIAIALREPINTVLARYHRARQKLRNEMGREGIVLEFAI